MKTIPLPLLLLGMLLALASPSAGDDDLLKEKKHLTRQLIASGSFIATYKAVNEKGEIFIFESGAHFKSGWAYIRGYSFYRALPAGLSWWQRLVQIAKVPEVRGIHLDPDGSWVFGEANRAIIFKDHPKFLSDLMKIRTGLFPLEDEGRFQAFPVLQTDRDRLDYSIQITLGSPGPLALAEKIVALEKDRTTLSAPELGQMTFDRKTGLLLSQTFKSDKGIRSIKLTGVQWNPGWLAVSKRVAPLPAEKKTVPFETSPLASSLIGQTFQQLVFAPGPIDLQTHLILQEKAFIHFMRRNAPSGKGLLKKEFLNGFLQAQIDKIAQALKKDPLDLLDDENFINITLRKMAFEIQRINNQIPAWKITAALIGRPLIAKNEETARRKKIIENFIVHCLYRHELERTLEAYRKELK